MIPDCMNTFFRISSQYCRIDQKNDYLSNALSMAQIYEYDLCADCCTGSNYHDTRDVSNHDFNTDLDFHSGGTRYLNWLRHYVTSRKVAGSIPDEVTGFSD
jgi:hypothetical protein